MKPANVLKNAAQAAFEPFETINSQVTKPVLQEAASELGSFFGAARTLGINPRSIAGEELQRARQKQNIQEMESQDTQNRQEQAERISNSISAVQNEYRQHESKTAKQDHQFKEEVLELQGEIAKLAKTAGVETKVHFEPTPKRVGVLDIKRLTSIARFLRIKAEESKSAKDLVAQRVNAKRATGMLAWVSGKQMKIYEQGTLQLQG